QRQSNSDGHVARFDADGLHRRGDEPSHGRFGDSAQHQRADRDPQLGTGQPEGQVAEAPEEALGCPIALGGPSLDPAAVDGDVGEFLRYEQAVDRDQEQDEAQSEPQVYSATSVITAEELTKGRPASRKQTSAEAPLVHAAACLLKASTKAWADPSTTSVSTARPA